MIRRGFLHLLEGCAAVNVQGVIEEQHILAVKLQDVLFLYNTLHINSSASLK